MDECKAENVCGPRLGDIICSQRRGDCFGHCLMKKSLTFFGTMTQDLMQFAMSARWATAIRNPEKDIKRFVKVFDSKASKIKSMVNSHDSNHQLTVRKFAKKSNKYLKRLIGDIGDKNIKKVQKLSKSKLRKMSIGYRKCTKKCVAGKDLASDLKNVRCNAMCARKLIKKL
jgi:hypothetical protein